MKSSDFGLALTRNTTNCSACSRKNRDTSRASTLLVVSHDRWFLDSICTHLIVFEGDSQAKMYLGNWSDYETMMRENSARI
jgi:ABC-type polysaccharide/polyol phosphate transport system ATPase subunit